MRVRRRARERTYQEHASVPMFATDNRLRSRWLPVGMEWSRQEGLATTVVNMRTNGEQRNRKDGNMQNRITSEGVGPTSKKKKYMYILIYTYIYLYINMNIYILYI